MARKKLEVKSGDKFGRLTIVTEIQKHVCKNGAEVRNFLCVCECGNNIEVLLKNLKQGRSKSCGCYRSEFMSNQKYRITHGKHLHPLYHTWEGMKSRCYNINADNYQNYGGRGIQICDRWLNSFENFLQDMGEKPEGTTIDRIDVNGNYEPTNCRWVSGTEQRINRRIKVIKEVQIGM